MRSRTTSNDIWATLGDLPPRPSQPQVSTQTINETPSYVSYTVSIDNSAGDTIPAIMLTPKNVLPPYPTILWLHVHGHRYDLGKADLFREQAGGHVPADVLTSAGYAVFCADAYAFGERQQPDEMTRFKRFLWEGKTLWGMMLRDDLICLDYLAAHPDVDATRIAAVGMSMGSTRAWWLGALDERVRTVVAVACLTRYADLIAADGLDYHSIYFYVPGILRAFDTEHILAHITPRPLLALTGDKDPTTPLSGVKAIESHLQIAYAEANATQNFRSIVYPDTGHTFTPQMWEAMMDWLDLHL